MKDSVDSLYQSRHADRPLQIFVSYAHEDADLCSQLLQHLSFLIRARSVDVWHDRRIGPGNEWVGEIDSHVDAADVILLLVSPAFGASRYCWDVETRRALERHRTGEARVIPVIVRPVDGWQETPIGELQALPRDGQAITSWQPRDEGFRNVVERLRALLGEGAKPSPRLEPELVRWTLVLEVSPGAITEHERAEISLTLRILTCDQRLDLLSVEEGSARLEFRSTRPAYDAVVTAHAEGRLAASVGHPVIKLSPAVGAPIRIETSITETAIESSLDVLPEVLGGVQFGEMMPPLVLGMAFRPEDWQRPGFHLGYDEADEPPRPEEQAQLQVRLGRYLNTFLVVAPEHHNVSLSPLADHAGLPAPLARTELGRDLLAQDVLLKHHTACLLYPGTPIGAEFWSRIEKRTPSTELEACMRVWIVPGRVTLDERMEAGLACIDVKRLSLEVRCASEQETLRKLRERGDAAIPSKAEDQALDVFRELALPAIQEEVSHGSRFGTLRQVFSVMILAAWFRRSQLGAPLREAGFLDSNAPERFQLDIGSGHVEALHRQYLELFRDGVWRYARSDYDVATNSVRQRLLVAGGISMQVSTQYPGPR